MRKSRSTAVTVALIGMLGALSAVLMELGIPLPFAPAFLKFDVSEMPALFAGFFLGPAEGLAVIVVKLLLHLILKGTETALVGEAMNLLGSGLFVLSASIIYKLHRTKAGAVASLLISSVSVSVLFIFLNAYVAFPMYAKLYGMPLSAIIAMGTAVNPHITDLTGLMLFSVFPFNLVKHLFTAALTFVLYKKAGGAIRSLLYGSSAVDVQE